MPESRMPMTLEELDHASTLVYRVMAPTPQYAWPKLRKRVGCPVWVKHENHTPTGSFKMRGGLVYLDSLQAESSRGEPGDGHARKSRPIHRLCSTAARAKSCYRRAVR